jgi:predicted TPR repeat methyltransferase
MKPQVSRGTAYFEQLYAANEDPWNFAGSDYEAQKYAATIDALGGRHFSRGLEIGCSIGVLTKALADLCEDLLAVDIADQPLARAKVRCAAATHVSFARMQVPTTWPAGSFDLIVFSEVLYFLTQADIMRTAALANGSLMPGGVLLLVNYTEKIDEPCSGEEAAEVFIHELSPPNALVTQLRAQSFRIDLLQKS